MVELVDGESDTDININDFQDKFVGYGFFYRFLNLPA